MTQEELDILVKEVGKQTAAEMSAAQKRFDDAHKAIQDEAKKNGGGVTADDFNAYKKIAEETQAELKEICLKQGVDINALTEKLQTGTKVHKSIAEVLQEAKGDLEKTFNQGSGTKSFMVIPKGDGTFTMQPYNPAVLKLGPEATIAGISGGVAAVTQAVDGAAILRMGSNAPIISQYRNTPWVFPFVNLINANISESFATYWEETPKLGGSTTVAEGGTKPASFYAYNLVSKAYKKEATIIGVTEEFHMDFARLESDIMGKGRADVMNRVNTAVLANIIAAATTYNTSVQFGVVFDVNNYDAIAAMAAQVDNATYGNHANVAFMSTFLKYHNGVLKSVQGEYLNPPDIIKVIEFVGNPDMIGTNAVVGDLTNYNIILRGGFIVKVGYNGTDFAENRFSIVMEQYYFDYISDIRKVGIVKGDLTTVKQSIYGGSISSQ